MKYWNHFSASGLRLLAAFGCLVLLASNSFGAVNSRFSVGLGFEFSSGDYGTTQTTDSYRIPLTIGYYPSRKFDFSLEIPYLYQSDSSTVLLGDTRFPNLSPVGGQGNNSSGMMAPRVAAVTGTSSTTTSNSQSGLGDVNLTAGYQLWTETATTPMIRPLAYIKLPTADKEKGLGTGAFDFGAGLSAGKIFGRFSLYAEGLYIFPGTTTTYMPDDYMTYQGSINYQLTQKLYSGVKISGGTSAFATGSDSLEIQLTSNYQLTPQGSFGVYLGKGLSDGSPDYTTGFYAAISF